LNFLLDTNVVSEWTRSRPNSNVVRWLFEADEDALFLSVITFAEIRQGIEELGPGERRDALARWVADDLTARFEPRILKVDLEVADHWGKLMARSVKIGTNLRAIDALFAATAQAHDLTLVTRNTRHFERLEVPLLNPWLPS
jgi:predicted nucleic acid-binding protein